MANPAPAGSFQASDAMFVYFSDILGADVLDSEGRFAGTVWDIAVRQGPVYPQTDALVLRQGSLSASYGEVAWEKVSLHGSDVSLSVRAADLTFSPESREHDLLLRRDILDQQVVDTFNHKVRRVNDIHLLRVERDLVVAHVDIGLRGVLRRLGWEKPADALVGFLRPQSEYLRKPELVSWKFVHPVALNPASVTMKLSIPAGELASMHAADLSEILINLTLPQRTALIRALDAGTKSRIFETLAFDEQSALLGELDKKEAAEIVKGMSSDEATDLLEKLPGRAAEDILALMETQQARKLSTMLGYASDSAGGLMTAEFLAVPESFTVEKALQWVREHPKDAESSPNVFLVDAQNRLKGITSVRRLICADPQVPAAKTGYPKAWHVHLYDGVKEVAYLMERYKMHSIPVVDEGDVLHGVVTVDDVLGQLISIAWRRKARGRM